jgi:hypothetical protein
MSWLSASNRAIICELKALLTDVKHVQICTLQPFARTFEASLENDLLLAASSDQEEKCNLITIQ